MKKLFFLIAAGAIAITACNNSGAADHPVKEGELTSIQWIDSTKEIGQVNEGQVVNISFRFKNTGQKPLVIKQVTASCGCTVAEKPEQPVSPGDEGVIKASFNSSSRIGHNTKTLTVIANTEGTTEHQLSFSVDVLQKPAK